MYRNSKCRDFTERQMDMKKKSKRVLLVLMTLLVICILGIQFDGNLSGLLERRADFIYNVKTLGGYRYTFSLASLKYYASCITEPFAFANIGGNIGIFAIFSFFVCVSFFSEKKLHALLYCSLVGILIELFQYFTWFGVFDVSDIILRVIGSLTGIFFYCLLLVVSAA